MHKFVYQKVSTKLSEKLKDEKSDSPLRSLAVRHCQQNNNNNNNSDEEAVASVAHMVYNTSKTPCIRNLHSEAKSNFLLKTFCWNWNCKMITSEKKYELQ